MLSQLYSRRWTDADGLQRGLVLRTTVNNDEMPCSTMAEDVYKRQPKGYLMIDLLRNSSETKVFEWIDNTKTDTIYNVDVYKRQSRDSAVIK